MNKSNVCLYNPLSQMEANMNKSNKNANIVYHPILLPTTNENGLPQ